MGPFISEESSHASDAISGIEKSVLSSPTLFISFHRRVFLRNGPKEPKVSNCPTDWRGLRIQCCIANSWKTLSVGLALAFLI